MDQYFDSCVFDLMTTGDANFTLAASSALKVRHRVINEVGQSSYAMNSASERIYIGEFSEHSLLRSSLYCLSLSQIHFFFQDHFFLDCKLEKSVTL